MHNLRRGHWEAVNWISWYIKSMIGVRLVFEKDINGKLDCTGYVDSDYAGDLDKCQSMTGYFFTLFQAWVSWRLNLQSTVALSTIEAEYMTMTKAIKGGHLASRVA